MAEPYTLYNVEISHYTYNNPAETKASGNAIAADNSPAVPGKTIAVDPNKIPLGSIVVINGVKYLANDTGSAIQGLKVDICCWTKEEAEQGGRTYGNIITVYPPGTTVDNDLDQQSFRNQYDIHQGSTFSNSWLNNSATLNSTQITNGIQSNKLDPDTKLQSGGTVTGAGVPSNKIVDYGIMSFASFAESLAFKSKANQTFSEDGMWSVHQYLSEFMTKFYHQMYYIPNLRNNFVMVVKPETLFINAPSCNLIFPNIKSQISYTNPYKQQPTRLLQITDPIGEISGQSGTPFTLTCMMFTEETKLEGEKNGLPKYSTFITSFGDQNKDTSGNPSVSRLTDKNHPVLNLTAFEERNGIRVSNVNKGADIYLFLKSQATTQSDSDDTYVMSLNSDSSSMQGIGQTLAALARYELARQRYVTRNGSLDCYFNPYIVPGFPLVSIETTENGLNIYGYVTGVVHNLTDRSWTTSVSFTCGHSDTEQSPGAYPIIESEYTSDLESTYKDMLGETVTPVTNSDIPSLMSQYGTDKTYVTQSLRKIWRETTSFDDYLKEIADGATVVEEDNYVWLKNGEGSSFFDTTIQTRIKEYSNNIISNTLAMSNDDVR
jgi:3D (Asp-Asp-Asp) domain-containing protein